MEGTSDAAVFLSDEAIAARVQQGEREAFGVLVERYEKKMTRYATKFLFGYVDAGDLVQETFLKAYANIKGFDVRRRFSPWLYRIAHNVFVNAVKRVGREPIPFFDPDTLFPHPLAPESADREATDRETRELLDRLLGRLPPKHREPLALHYFEGMRYQEIAEILRVPLSTVGVRIMRARKALKAVMQEQDALRHA